MFQCNSFDPIKEVMKFAIDKTKYTLTKILHRKSLRTLRDHYLNE